MRIIYCLKMEINVVFYLCPDVKDCVGSYDDKSFLIVDNKPTRQINAKQSDALITTVCNWLLLLNLMSRLRKGHLQDRLLYSYWNGWTTSCSAASRVPSTNIINVHTRYQDIEREDPAFFNRENDLITSTTGGSSYEYR